MHSHSHIKIKDQERKFKKKYKTGNEKRDRKRKQVLERVTSDVKHRRLFADGGPIKKSSECDDFRQDIVIKTIKSYTPMFM